jgi:hypothetical protein
MINFSLKNQKVFKLPARIIGLILAIITIFIFCLVLPGCEKILELKTSIVSLFNREEEADKVVRVVDEFFSAMIEKNYSKAYSYICYNKNKTPDDFKKEISNITDIVSIEINWVEVKNNIAIVGVDMIDKYDGEEKIYKDLKISLVKDD